MLLHFIHTITTDKDKCIRYKSDEVRSLQTHISLNLCVRCVLPGSMGMRIVLHYSLRHKVANYLKHLPVNEIPRCLFVWQKLTPEIGFRTCIPRHFFCIFRCLCSSDQLYQEYKFERGSVLGVTQWTVGAVYSMKNARGFIVICSIVYTTRA